VAEHDGDPMWLRVVLVLLWGAAAAMFVWLVAVTFFR
jgi:hypothetical protein